MLDREEQIETIDRLLELLPTEGSTNTFLKVSDRMDDVARQFIDHAPFVIVATNASEGSIGTKRWVTFRMTTAPTNTVGYI